MDADRQGKSPYDFSQSVTDEIRKIKNKIDGDHLITDERSEGFL